MAKRVKRGSLVVVFGLMIGLMVTSCVSVDRGPLTPDASRSVVIVKRSESNTERRTDMEVYINGRKERQEVENGEKGEYHVMNGITNIQVKIDKYDSQLLTFDCSSEVVEFLVHFEGSGKKSTLSLTKVSGGTGNRAAAGGNAAGPVINIQVDNSSSNSASSSGNSSTNTVSGDDNSVH